MKTLDSLSQFERDSLKSFAKNELKVDPALLLAMIKVECSGNPFDEKGRPVIQYEGHVFWRNLKRKGIDPRPVSFQHPSICYENWDRRFYRVGTDDDYERLSVARTIDEEAALEACSWGAGQIMGYHWRKLGHRSIYEFVDSNKTALGQLQNFARFLEKEAEGRLLLNMQTLDRNMKDEELLIVIRGVVSLYNGQGYEIHDYHGKVMREFKRAVSEGW